MLTHMLGNSYVEQGHKVSVEHADCAVCDAGCCQTTQQACVPHWMLLSSMSNEAQQC